MSAAATRVPENAASPALRVPFAERGALRIFVKSDRFLPNLLGCVAAIARPGPPKSSIRPGYFARTAAFPRIYRGPSASLSLVLHAATIAFLVYLPSLSPAASPLSQSQWHASQTIYYYRIPLPEVAKPPQPVSMTTKRLPASRPTVAQAPKPKPAPAHPLAALISKPAHPDNLRQTIYQSASPPDLIIRTEQKLPNVVILQQNQPDLKAPLLQNYSRPAAVERQAFAPEAPVVMVSSSPTPAGMVIQLAENDPHLVIPVAGGGAPIKSGAATSEGPPSNAPDLVVVGVDPGDPRSELSLPNGNRWGEFSLAPPAQPGGQPTGTAGGSDAKGSGKENSAGSGSRGLSASSGTPGPLDMTGAKGGGTGILAPPLAVSLVYPIVQPAMTVRRNTMVISSGPIGGGGLNVYGALNCGKIYSVFLPMPGRDWSLQYCDRSASGKVAPDPQSAVIRLESPLLPPDADLQHRYNFKRSPLPPPMANRPIILKGVIGTDGKVEQLVVFRGVAPVMDEAARIAFSRWRFKPAMRDGKAVAVDILVGIPPAAGQDYVNR